MLTFAKGFTIPNSCSGAGNPFAFTACASATKKRTHMCTPRKKNCNQACKSDSEIWIFETICQQVWKREVAPEGENRCCNTHNAVAPTSQQRQTSEDTQRHTETWDSCVSGIHQLTIHRAVWFEHSTQFYTHFEQNFRTQPWVLQWKNVDLYFWLLKTFTLLLSVIEAQRSREGYMHLRSIPHNQNTQETCLMKTYFDTINLRK